MGKYADIETAIFSVFDLTAWENTTIKTFPNNFLGKPAGNEYIRVTIICGNRGANYKSVSGVLHIDIFTQSGDGPSRSTAIADSLDDFLVNKTLSLATGRQVQFLASTLSVMGVDRDNNALYRHLYSIPFYYFGVT